MSTTINLFSGWLGFGSALGSNVPSEPTDTAYVRRPVILGPLCNGSAQDSTPGTIGPASTAWAPLLFAGLFDAQTGGNCLATWTLARPVVLASGQTWTSQGNFTLTLDGGAGLSPLAPRSWVAGTRIGTIGGAGAVVTAMLNLQLLGGRLLAASTPAVASSPTVGGNLPTVAPASGSGQLWNNGGVICIA